MNRHNDKNIKEVLGLFLKTNQKLSEGYQTTRIEEIWNQRMGEAIASYTSKIQLKGGVLLVEVRSAPLKKELLMAKAKIQEIINEEMGGDYIKDVKIY